MPALRPSALLLAVALALPLGMPHNLMAADTQAATTPHTSAVRVLASLPVTYGLAGLLLKDSGIQLERAADANLPGSRQNAYFTGRGAASLQKLASQADAVIGLRSVWPDDSLYPIARRSNIRIVEIDAARPVDGSLPGVALQPGKPLDGLNAQPWLSSSNLGRMADVMAADLVRLAPHAKPVIEAHLAQVKQHLLKISASAESRLANADNLSVLSLSDRLDYLIAGLNLDRVDTQHLADDQWGPQALDTLTRTLRDGDVKVVLDHRQPADPVKAAIAAAGSRLVVIDSETGDPVTGLEHAVGAVVSAVLQQPLS